MSDEKTIRVVALTPEAFSEYERDRQKLRLLERYDARPKADYFAELVDANARIAQLEVALASSEHARASIEARALEYHRNWQNAVAELDGRTTQGLEHQ